MHPSLHAEIFQLYILFSLTLFPLIMCGLASSSFGEALAFFLAYGLFYLAIFYWLPVSCRASGCSGRAKRTMTRTSFWKVKLIYTCKSCAGTHERKVFYPNITVEVSG